MTLTEMIDGDNKSHCSCGPHQQTSATYAWSPDDIFSKSMVIKAETAEFCCRTSGVLSVFATPAKRKKQNKKIES